MRTNYPRHLRTFDYVGLHSYFLTWCTDARKKHFTVADKVNLVMGQIVRAAADERFAISAHCFMPDHLHLLIEAQSPASDGRRFIKQAKQFSGYSFSREYQTRLWQRYGYEHVLRDDESVFSFTRYIVENPVRAGLVARVEDYPFLGSQQWTLKEILQGIADAGPTKRQLLEGPAGVARWRHLADDLDGSG
jgi:putative transposase